MLVNRNMSPIAIIKMSWIWLLYFTFLSTIVYVLFEHFDIQKLAVPFLPIATIGTAVAFYIGFKNNASYDRLWEARKIWGTIINDSRTFGTWVINWIGEKNENEDNLTATKKELIYRHLAYINVLKTQLRKDSVWEGLRYNEISHQITGETNEQAFKKNVKIIVDNFLTDEEKKEIPTRTNKATYLLTSQSKLLTQLRDEGKLTEFDHNNLELLIKAFFDHQGASERIKTFPFPRQYGFFSTIFVFIFVTFLPFGLIGILAENDLSWLTIPTSILISWIFITMEQIGDSSENPFENSFNDVPLNAICRTIEIDLREMLHEENIPEKVKPINGVLM